MKKMLMVFLFFCSFLTASVLPDIPEGEKLYFDLNEMPVENECFYIHLGGNEWVKSSSIHRDTTGFFTFVYNVAMKQTGTGVQFAKEWKCPYCNHFWPWGQPCGNPNCPGKFK